VGAGCGVEGGLVGEARVGFQCLHPFV
jgi:hypothetical protein